MAKRKLDAMGNVRGTCGFANDPERLKRLKSQLQLADSLSEINKVTAEEKALKNSKDTAELVDKAPAAMLKLTTTVATRPAACRHIAHTLATTLR